MGSSVVSAQGQIYRLTLLFTNCNSASQQLCISFAFSFCSGSRTTQVLVTVSSNVWQQPPLHKQVNISAPPTRPPSKHLHFPAVSGAQLLEPTVHLPFMIVINGRVTRWMIFRSNKQKETICMFLQQRDMRSRITSSPSVSLGKKKNTDS